MCAAPRYDGRAHLSDKTMFCLKPNIAKRLTKEEEELEVALDEERYLSLNRDIMEEELMKGESLMNTSVSATCICVYGGLCVCVCACCSYASVTFFFKRTPLV